MEVGDENTWFTECLRKFKMDYNLSVISSVAYTLPETYQSMQKNNKKQ